MNRNLDARLRKVETDGRKGVQHVIFGRTQEDIAAQLEALRKAGACRDGDTAVQFLTIYEEPPCQAA